MVLKCSVLKLWPWGNFSHLQNSCPDAMPVLVNERCVWSMTQLLCFSFRESDCTAASTASTRLSSSKYLPPPICKYSLLSRWTIAYSWRIHIRPMTYTLSVMAELTPQLPRMAALTTSLLSSSQAFQPGQFMCSTFVSGSVWQAFKSWRFIRGST